MVRTDSGENLALARGPAYSIDSESSDEETAAAVAKCCCCTIDTQVAQPSRWFRLQQAVCRLLGGFLYLCFILLAVRRVNFVVTKSTDKVCYL